MADSPRLVGKYVIKKQKQVRLVDFLQRKLAFAIAMILLLVPLGCVHGPLTTHLRADVLRPPHAGIILFLCDGLAPDVMERGCRAGWLPNIQKRFVTAGTRVENAFTVVPSITYAAITSILTGVTPAKHGIPGNRWFDPDQQIFRDYATIAHYRDVNLDFDVPTVYERIDPHLSTSIQAAHMRGVSRNIANWAQSGVRWYFGAYTGVDALTATTVDKVAHEANRQGEWPSLLTCYFPGLDSIGHLHGVSSAEYQHALENFDHHLGRVCDWLVHQGLLETTYIVLLSDHGMVDVDQQIDLVHLVRDDWGRNATAKLLQDGSFEHRRRYFDRYDTVVVYQDGRKASLHFAGSAAWDNSPDPADVEHILTAPAPELRLWSQAGIDLVAYLRGDNEAILRSARGEARIVERETTAGLEYRYVPVPDDVLDYQGNPELAAFVAGGFHNSRAWLRATCRQTFPDLIPQIIPLLRQRRFGQVLIFTSRGYSFNEEAGGHGGIQRDEMRIPLIFAGPGIAAGGTIECARTVDLVPTIMALLGIEGLDDDLLDGVPLFADLPVCTVDEMVQIWR